MSTINVAVTNDIWVELKRNNEAINEMVALSSGLGGLRQGALEGAGHTHSITDPTNSHGVYDPTYNEQFRLLKQNKAMIATLQAENAALLNRVCMLQAENTALKTHPIMVVPHTQPTVAPLPPAAPVPATATKAPIPARALGNRRVQIGVFIP